jgi:hypothetical protein
MRSKKGKKWQKGQKKGHLPLLPLFAFFCFFLLACSTPTRPRAQPNSVQIGLRAVGVSD